MSMNINTNLSSIYLQRSLSVRSSSIQTLMQRLSSGIRINSASDDAAGLCLSKKLDLKISGIEIANNNIQTGNAQLQTFSSYIDTMSSDLQRVRELALKAANGVYSTSERNMINDNAKQILAGIGQATNQANKEVKAKAVNTVGFMDTITKVTTGYDAAHTINNAAEFVSKITGHLSENFVLANDIDMSALGTLNNSVITGTFSGQLDGNGYSVENISINTNAVFGVDNIGLFSQTNGATIKNLSVENTNIQATKSFSVGAVVGYSVSSSINNCYATTSNYGLQGVGGLIGFANSSTVSDCYTIGLTSGPEMTGGLIGRTTTSTLSNCYSAETVSCYGGTFGRAGGLVGVNSITTINNCYATGNVSGSPVAGGLVGRNISSTILNSYSTGSVEGGDYTGGFVGINGWTASSIIQNCYSTGDVYANGTRVGGFAGNNNLGTIQNCYSTGNVFSSLATIVGGFAGNNNLGIIQNCYSTGSVSGDTTVAGFIGSNNNLISNCYSTGAVSANSIFGGFTGVNTGTIDSTNFWDTEKSGQSSSAGGTGLTSAQIDTGAGTTGWDKTLWDTNSGKPELLWDQTQNTMSVQAGETCSSTSKFDIKYIGLDFNVSGGLNLDLSSVSGANSALSTIDNAINYLSIKQSQVGSNLNSLNGRIQTNKTRFETITNAASTIRDTDIATVSANLTKQQILQQASISLLKQVKSMDAESVLNLLNLR